MKVYLAGKFSGKYNWRSELVDSHRTGPQLDPDIVRTMKGTWPVIVGIVLDQFDYVGPYLMPFAEHGRDNDHGILMDFTSKEVFGDLTGVGWNHSGDDHLLREEVVRLCRVAIGSADVFFAWFDSKDAYGTLVELGYAMSEGVTIWVGFDRSLIQSDPRHEQDLSHDLWFAEHSADISIITDSAKEAFEECLSRDRYITQRLLKTMPYADYLQTDHWKQVREAALQRAEHRCQLCNNGANLNVHHRTYENRGNERDSDVTVLCKSCHERFHVVINGRVTNQVR